MKPIWFLIIFVCVSIPIAVYGNDKDEWPEGSAMYAGQVALKKMTAEDKKLNEIYKKLMNSLSNDSVDDLPKKTLIDAQRAWLKYRDASCSFYGEILGGARTWESTYSTECEAELTKRRVDELQLAYDCINGPKDIAHEECKMS